MYYSFAILRNWKSQKLEKPGRWYSVCSLPFCCGLMSLSLVLSTLLIRLPPLGDHTIALPKSADFPSLSLPQLHNEDDSSEASTSEQQDEQPCTSASAQSSSQDPGQTGAQAGTAPVAAATLREVELPPPPYASIDLGAGASAGAAAAPGGWKISIFCRFL